MRAGISRRTRHGSVWVSFPAWMLLAFGVLILPELVLYWYLELLVIAALWTTSELIKGWRAVRRDR